MIFMLMFENMNKIIIKCTIAAALGGLLFGYDTVIINGAMLDLVKYFQLTPVIQGWTVSSALVGFLYLKKYIVETKGKTLEQIEKDVLA